MKNKIRIVIIFMIMLTFLCVTILADDNEDMYSTQSTEDLTLEELFIGLQDIPLDSLELIIDNANDHDLLLTAIQILAASKSDKAIELLIKILDIGVNNVQTENGVVTNDFWDVRIEAAYALGQLGATEAVPKLVEILQKDEDPIVKAYIAMALGKIGDKSVVPLLISMLQMYKVNYKSTTAPLIYGLIVALGDLGDPSAFGILLEISQGNFPLYIRQTAIAAIKKIQSGGSSSDNG